MVDESNFIDHIADAVLAGRIKNRGAPRDLHYQRLKAILYAQDVARKLPGLFRSEHTAVSLTDAGVAGIVHPIRPEG